MKARLQRVADMVENNEYVQATKELKWLWNHMLDEDKSYSGVRGSYLVGWMKHVAEHDESAMREFTNLRDELQSKVERENPDFESVIDWFTLSDGLLGDNKAIGIWVDRLISFEKETDVFKIMRSTIHSWLCNQNRWQDAGGILEAGSLLIAKNRLQAEENIHDNQLSDESRSALNKMHLVELARIHASLLAAHRDDEAWSAAELILEYFEYDDASVVIRDIVKKAGVESAKHDVILK